MQVITELRTGIEEEREEVPCEMILGIPRET